MAKRLVIVGNGMAPGRALELLFQRAPGAFDVTIFNAEPRVNYDRIMLSPVLAGEKSFEEIVIHGDGWYVEHGITLYKGTTVTAIDRSVKTVTTARGLTVPYDTLVIATGSLPIILPVPGRTLAGVLTYRDLDDVQAMMLASRARGHAVVIGGGLLGLEAAVGLSEQGMTVTVVHLAPTLMERQLDAAAGKLLRRALEARGISVRCGASTEALLGEKKVEAVRLADGAILPADLVVMAVGIRPNVQLAKEAGLTIARGIAVSPDMRTSDADIFAIGECAETHGQVFGLVAPLYEMAAVLAAQLAGDTAAAFQPSAVATKLKVTGLPLFSAGDFGDGPDLENIVVEDAARGIYKRLVVGDGKLVGAVLMGDTADGAYYFDLVRSGRDISVQRETLAFGRAYAEAGEPAPIVASPPKSAVVPLPKARPGATRGDARERRRQTS